MNQTSVPDYRLKLERALRHINELDAEIRSYIATEPFSVYIEEDGVQRHWKLKMNTPVPAMWSGIVGDAIHNIRSALDLLMVAIVKHCDPGRASYKHVYFVIRKSKLDFDGDLPKNMKGADANAISVVSGLKPYLGGEDAFWALHQLDILDKHKAIVPVGSAYQALQLDIGKAFGLKALGIPASGLPTLDLIPANKLFPLKDGDTLFSTPIDDVNHQYAVNFKFEIAIGEYPILGSESVNATFSRFYAVTEQAVLKCETDIFGLHP